LNIEKIVNENNGLEHKIDDAMVTMAPLYTDIPPVFPDEWILETPF